MNERKTRKVLEINENGLHLECIKDYNAKYNPYRLYRVWWDGGWHRKLIDKFGDFQSVVAEVYDISIGKVGG